MELGEVKEALELSAYPEAVTRALLKFYPSTVNKACGGEEADLKKLARLVKFGMACRAMPPRISASDHMELLLLVNEHARVTRNGQVRRSWARIAEEWNRLHPEKPLKGGSLRRWYQRYAPGSLPVMQSLIEASARYHRAASPILARFNDFLEELKPSIQAGESLERKSEGLVRESRLLKESLRAALENAAEPLGAGERHFFLSLHSDAIEALSL